IVFLAQLAFGWMLGIFAGIVGGMVSLLGAGSDGSGGAAAIQQPSLLSRAGIVSATTKPRTWLSASIGSLSVAVCVCTHLDGAVTSTAGSCRKFATLSARPIPRPR